MKTVFATAAPIALAAAPAFAHVGHLGEAAGHAHWIGLAAAAGATVIGAVLTGKRAKTKADAKEAGADEAGSGAEAEQPA